MADSTTDPVIDPVGTDDPALVTEPAATAPAAEVSEHPVLVVDFGAQYAQLIARRVREANIYSEIVPSTMSTADMLAKKPAAIVLSGGPSSVYAENAPQVDAGLFDADVPVFGICYGFQAMATALGGRVDRTGRREYGGTALDVTDSASALFHDLPTSLNVWMSHGDSVAEAPPGFAVTASTLDTPIAGFENLERRLAGVQYHPEVGHSEHGQEVLRRFLHDVAGLDGSWTAHSILAEQITLIKEQIGDQEGHLRAVRRSRLRGRRGDRARGRRRPADLRVRRPRAAAGGGAGAGAARLRRRHRHQAGHRRRRAAVPRRARRGHRARDQAQDHRPRVHPVVRGRGRFDRRGGGRRRLPGPGHPLPGRRRVRRRHRHGHHQEPPQRRRPARGPEVRAGRAAAEAVQGRGPVARRASWACRRRSSAGSRSPGRAWASASSAR